VPRRLQPVAALPLPPTVSVLVVIRNGIARSAQSASPLAPAAMHLNANLPAAYFGVPTGQLVEMGLEVALSTLNGTAPSCRELLLLLQRTFFSAGRSLAFRVQSCRSLLTDSFPRCANCALMHCRKVPLFDYLVGAHQHRGRDV
jgi:hypothetical protein